MQRLWLSQYSGHLQREMHILVHGHGGVPVLAFPCQDSMCDNFEGFGMIDTLYGFIESGQIQVFTVDTVDKESWSDVYGDKGHRAWIQECYYRYIVDEALPYIREVNQTGIPPITTGCSLGATHAAIVFLRRPELFSGVLSLSGCYRAEDFWDGWCNEVLYDNSPVDFMANMPNDHPYINLYNERKIILCSGQGAWESGLDSTIRMGQIFREKGINAWVDLWGYDVNHDWPWWKKQIVYFMPFMLGWQ